MCVCVCVCHSIPPPSITLCGHFNIANSFPPATSTHSKEKKKRTAKESDGENVTHLAPFSCSPCSAPLPSLCAAVARPPARQTHPLGRREKRGDGLGRHGGRVFAARKLRPKRLKTERARQKIYFKHNLCCLVDLGCCPLRPYYDSSPARHRHTKLSHAVLVSLKLHSGCAA